MDSVFERRYSSRISRREDMVTLATRCVEYSCEELGRPSIEIDRTSVPEG